MHQLHSTTLRPLAALICGDNGPHYRKGYELVEFFRDAGLACSDYDGGARFTWTLARLVEYNQNAEHILKVLEQLANPREYPGKPEVLQAVIALLNSILALDGLQIVLVGMTPRLRSIEAAVPQATSQLAMGTQIRSGSQASSVNKVPTMDLLGKVEELKYLLIESSAHNEPDSKEVNERYRLLRRELLSTAQTRASLPTLIHACRDLGEFWAEWSDICENSRDYASRGIVPFLREVFDPILSLLEAEVFAPSDSTNSAVLLASDSAHIRDTWQKALERRATDPEGAITTARTLLETVCKHILDEEGVSYEDSMDLPKLHKLTASTLNLAPDQHTEQIFKQILGGCQTIAEGLGALRNRLSDAHGKGKLPVRPAARHATLAVNLAGTMAAFLIETWEARKGK